MDFLLSMDGVVRAPNSRCTAVLRGANHVLRGVYHQSLRHRGALPPDGQQGSAYFVYKTISA